MQVTISSNFPTIAAQLRDDAKQPRYAAMQAINDTIGLVQAAQIKAMQSVFDRPTPFILRSVSRTYANRQSLSASVFLRYPGGKAVDPNSVLRAEIDGGSRSLKRAEVALRRVGVLPAGYYLAQGSAAPLDAYGNVPGSFIVRLITYFQAAGEQGYRANMTDKSKRRLAKFGKSASGARTINGVQYFAAYGRLRSNARDAHLAPAIYSRRGVHGSDVSPVLMFVRKPAYQRRLAWDDIAKQAIDSNFPVRFAERLAQAWRTAR